MKKGILSALTAIALAACGGGGGGGGSSSTTSTVGVSGVASKGLLGSATVRVYAVSGGTKGTLLGTTTTNANGEYELTGLTATTSPIIVEIETTSATTMCDEIKPLVGGKFDCTSAPGAGTVIRSTLPDLSATSVAHVTPFSEMAVAAAASTGSFTAESLAVGQAAVQETLGFNPMTVKPVNADGAMDANQEKMMALLSAVMLDAKLNASACTGDTTTGTKCMVERLKTSAALTSTGAGTYNAPSIAAGVNGPKNNFNAWTAGTPMTNAAGQTVAANSITKPSNAFMTAAAAKATSIATFSNPSAIDPAKAKLAQGLESFISSMREGVNKAKDKIDERLKASQLRTDALIGKGTTEGFDLVNLVAKNCDVASSGLTCTSVTTGAADQRINYVKVNDQKWCFYHTLAENGVNYTVSGNFQATKNDSTGVASGTLDGTTTTYFSGNPCSATNSNTKVSELSMVLSGTGLKDGSTSGNVTISTLKFKAYDQAANSSKWAQVALSGLSLSANKPTSVNNLATATLTAPLVVTSSDGDNISGTLTANIKDICTNGATPCIKRSHATYINVAFSGTLKEGAIVSFNVTVSQTVAGFGETGYHPYSENSASNPVNGTASYIITFADNVTLALSESLTGWNSSNLGVNFTSNGATLYMTAKGKNARVGTNEQVLDGDITVTSTGAYKATLREGTDHKAAGEVYQGSTQIGNIVGGVLYLRNTNGSNGQIISLK